MFKWFAGLRTILDAVFSYRPRQSAGLNAVSSLRPDWGAVFRKLVLAFEDYKANKPLPPAAPMTGEQLAAGVRKLQAALVVFEKFVAEHPGSVTAAEDFLEALRAGGLTWAADMEPAVSGAPSALATAENWLPTLIGLLGAFQPAPIGIPGGLDGARGHVGGGSQDGAPQTPAVDNPSGAIGGDDPNRGQ